MLKRCLLLTSFLVFPNVFFLRIAAPTDGAGCPTDRPSIDSGRADCPVFVENKTPQAHFDQLIAGLRSGDIKGVKQVLEALTELQLRMYKAVVGFVPPWQEVINIAKTYPNKFEIAFINGDFSSAIEILQSNPSVAFSAFVSAPVYQPTRSVNSGVSSRNPVTPAPRGSTPRRRVMR